MAKIRVTRKGYTAQRGKKKYTVKKSSFMVKDKGKPGKTPESERWFKPGNPLGWRKDLTQKERRARALRNRSGDHLAVARALVALANITTDKQTRLFARKDADYFLRMHEFKMRERK